jgi:hypothetical protein
VSTADDLTRGTIDVGFRVVDDLAVLIRNEVAKTSAPSAKTVVTAAIRSGLAAIQDGGQLTIGNLANDAGFAQFHAHLRQDEIDALNALRLEVEKRTGSRKVPFRYVLRECLVRGLSDVRS